MQNTEASVPVAGVPGLTGPAGVPLSLIVRQAVLPKQPTCAAVWPGQKRPPGSVLLAVPVVSGERLTAITPTCAPSQQLPPPAVQGQLVVGLGVHAGLPGGGHGVVASPTPPVGQSRVTPVEL